MSFIDFDLQSSRQERTVRVLLNCVVFSCNVDICTHTLFYNRGVVSSKAFVSIAIKIFFDQISNNYNSINYCVENSLVAASQCKH